MERAWIGSGEGDRILTGDGEDAGLGHVVAGGELDLGQAAAAAAALGDAHAHRHLVPVPLSEDPGLAPAFQLHVVSARPRHVAAARCRSAGLSTCEWSGFDRSNWVVAVAGWEGNQVTMDGENGIGIRRTHSKSLGLPSKLMNDDEPFAAFTRD